MSRWLCRLGLHADVRVHAPEGAGWFGLCRRCGRERHSRPKNGQ